MAGKKHREKGARFERAVVEAMNAFGMDAKRVPLSGAATGFKGDVVFSINGESKRAECKSRKDGFKVIRSWLGDNDILAIKDDRTEPLIVMRLSDYCILAGRNEPSA